MWERRASMAEAIAERQRQTGAEQWERDLTGPETEQ